MYIFAYICVCVYLYRIQTEDEVVTVDQTTKDIFPVLGRFDLGYIAIPTCRFSWCQNWVVVGVIGIFDLKCVPVCVRMACAYV